MRKAVYIILIILIITAGTLLLRPPKEINTYPENSQHCNADSDCVLFITECGYCNDYDTAINKEYYGRYLEVYQSKCKLNARLCTDPPKGKSTCTANKCTVNK